MSNGQNIYDPYGQGVFGLGQFMNIAQPAAGDSYNQLRNAVVAQNIEFRPISTCPVGTTVLLLTNHNVCIKGIYRKGDTAFKGWFPMPNIPEYMK